MCQKEDHREHVPRHEGIAKFHRRFCGYSDRASRDHTRAGPGESPSCGVRIGGPFRDSPLGRLWMGYMAIRYEKNPFPMLLPALFVPFTFVWYCFERVRPGKSRRKRNCLDLNAVYETCEIILEEHLHHAKDSTKFALVRFASGSANT